MKKTFPLLQTIYHKSFLSLIRKVADPCYIALSFPLKRKRHIHVLKGLEQANFNNN